MSVRADWGGEAGSTFCHLLSVITAKEFPHGVEGARYFRGVNSDGNRIGRDRAWLGWAGLGWAGRSGTKGIQRAAKQSGGYTPYPHHALRKVCFRRETPPGETPNGCMHTGKGEKGGGGRKQKCTTKTNVVYALGYLV